MTIFPDTTAPLVTRRAVIGTGAVAASLAYAGSSAASAQAAGGRAAIRPIDALLIDDGVDMPRPLADFVTARARTLPVVTIRLDAAGHSALNRVLNESHVIVGITAGATLFCVERIAWEHGYRLTARTQRGHADFNAENGRQLVAAFLNDAHPFTASPARPAAAYRPSLNDRTLHAWAMRKDARTRSDHTESRT
jgi:hypothetical protein